MINYIKIFLIILMPALLVSGCSTPCNAGDKQLFRINGINFAMIYVPSKNFFTGTDDKATGSVKRAFRISETEVTYELWDAVSAWAMKNKACNFANPGIKGYMNNGSSQQPVTTINWRDTIIWCNALTEMCNAETGTHYVCVYKADGKPLRDASGTCGSITDSVLPDPCANGFRLCSKDEWELAARYRSDLNNDNDIMDADEYYPGDYASGSLLPCTDIDAAGSVAVFQTGSTAQVRSKLPNALGIFDMSGNIAEWCFDWYPGSEGSARIARGGSWIASADMLQIGLITRYDPFTEFFLNGFRIAKNE